MTTQERFQIPLEVAEIYEARFVPAIFAEWAPVLVDAVGIDHGSRVIDVACGTGIVARTAADRVGDRTTVIGVDLNPSMLTVAARVAPDIDWRTADATDLPFDDDEFDVAVCQMALMFMTDRRRALAEMARVVSADGTVGIVVPAALPDQPAYAPFVDVAVRHAGSEARSLLGTYWNCGDSEELRTSFESAGLAIDSFRTRAGSARFESADDLVATEIQGSPLFERIDDATYERIRSDTADAFADRFTADDGTFEAPLLGHVVTAHPA